MRCKLLIGTGALALLVALYGAAGYWLAPGYLRQTLTELAAEHGYRLEMGKVRTQPFALRAELKAVALRTTDGRVLAAAESASAELACLITCARCRRGQPLSLFGRPSAAADA